jgi:ribosome-binding factor A
MNEKSEKIERLNEILKRAVSEVILTEKDFPNTILITVTRADTSPDLSQVKIYVSVMPDSKKKEVMDGLNKNIYHIQQVLNSKMKLRRVPKIILREEKLVRQAARVEELLHND